MVYLADIQMYVEQIRLLKEEGELMEQIEKWVEEGVLIPVEALMPEDKMYDFNVIDAGDPGVRLRPFLCIDTFADAVEICDGETIVTIL